MATVRIQIRRGTAAEWTSANPVLAAGEAGLETDTRKIKFGDGSSTWSSLNYLNPGDIEEISQDAVNAALTMGSGLTKTYNDASNTITLAVDTSVIATKAELAEVSQDSVNDAIVAGTGLDKTYNDAANTITLDIDSTVTTNSGSQTLTNKTINLTNNTISGTIAQFNTALSDANFATLSGTETLTNKTISGNTNIIALRADISNNWSTNNPLLSVGELGIETDTLKIKIGDGTHWNSITQYANVVPSNLNTTLSDYLLVADLGTASGPAQLDGLQNLLIPNDSIIFEGATDDSYETTLVVTDPTADRTITLPDITGTIITTGDTGTVSNTMLAGSIANEKLLNSAITINGTSVSLGGTRTLGTDDVSEGSTNKYFTEERAQDSVNNALTAGSGISKTYDDNANTITIANTGVTGVTGTTNQISASSSTGSVTLSLPNAVTFPGTVTLNADPTQALHAVTKQYADGIAAGLNWKQAVNLLATSNIALSGNTNTITIDGHATLTSTHDGYRLLLKNQTTDSENGIYVYSDNGTTYTLTRSSDSDAYGELEGASVFIMEGTLYAATSWTQTNHYLSSFSGQSWSQFSGAGTYVAGNGLDLTGNSFEIDTNVTVDVSTAQTLTNKTLTSPNINEAVALTATATELNILDGVTASTAELNILDGVTASTAELNILDGVTASTAEINYVDGVTSSIQTQIDSKTSSTDFTNHTGSSSAHGVSGNIVGTSSTQTLTNKTIDAANNTLSNISQSSVTDLVSDLALKSPLASPTFTGTPAAPTAITGTNTTQIATTAFVKTSIDNLIDGAPSALNTLNELAAAINNDSTYSATVSSLISGVATDLSNHESDNTTHGVVGAIVGTTDTQTLTNKTIDGSLNTLTVPQSSVTNLVTDLNLKAPLASPAITGTATFESAQFTGTVTLPSTTTSIGDISYSELSVLNGVTASTAELNILDGVTASTAELNILDGVTASAAELNILDGVTASTAEINKLSGLLASTAELNILDGITASTAELNILDGVTASAAELNILDGISVSTTELNYIDGLSGNIQDLLNNKQDKVSGVSDIEIGYLDGVTSAIQTQIDSKISSSSINTLTNKSINLANNTVTGTISEFNSALSDGDFASLSGTETLTNKTISSTNNTISITSNQVSDFTEAAQDAIGNNLGSGLSYNDTSGAISVDTLTIQAKVSGVSDTEIGYLDGVTSAIQTQLNSKLDSSTASSTYAPLASPTFTGTVTLPSETVTSNMILDGTIVNADINASAAIALSKLATDPLARANHTGTQTASTISDFDTQVRTNRLDQMAVPTASVSLSSQKITNLATPTSASDAATKQYVDDVTAGINFHEAVHAATVANLNATYNNGTSGVGATLTNAGTNAAITIDGHSLNINERVLVKDQTTATQNGIYVVTTVGDGSTAWVLTRATDADNSPAAEMKAGDFTFCQNGTTNSGFGFINNSSGTITIGTTNISYTTFNASRTIIAGTGLSEPTPGTLAIDSTVVTLSGSQTLTNKTLTSPILTTPELGTPTSVTLTNATGLPISTGISGLGTGIATFLATPSSANLISAITDETGTGSLVFSASPTFTGTVVLPTTTSIGNVSSTELGYLDGVTSAIQTQLDAKDDRVYSFATESGTSITLSSATHENKMVKCTSSSAVSITVPTAATEANFAVGDYVDIIQYGAGQITVAGAVGVTIRATDSQLKTRTQYSTITLVKMDTNEWLLTGDTTA